MANEQGRPAAKLGCLGTIVLGIVGAIVSLFVFTPWALHMGSRLTPGMRWHGYGKMHSSYGADYGLYLDIYFSDPGQQRSAVQASNLNGSAMLCGPKLQAHKYRLSGTVYGAWLNADGKRMVLHLYSPNDGQKLDFSLEGAWEGQQLNLNDRGSLASGFNQDGSPRGVGVGTYGPKEKADVTLEYGGQSDFEAICRNLGVSSR
jgi:hypothetical protein